MTLDKALQVVGIQPQELEQVNPDALQDLLENERGIIADACAADKEWASACTDAIETILQHIQGGKQNETI